MPRCALIAASGLANSAAQAYEKLGGPRMGTAKIPAAAVVCGEPIVRRWLQLRHRSGRLVNHGKAQLCVSVVFDPVGPVRICSAVCRSDSASCS